MTNLLQAIEQNTAPQLVLDLLLYLTPQECAKLAACSRMLRHISSNDHLWESYAQRITISPFCSVEVNNRNILLVKSLLHIRDFKTFFAIFGRMKYPLIGWFRLARSKQNPNLNGGLFLMSVGDNKLMCQQIDSIGNVVLGNDSYYIRYCNKKRKLIGRCVLSDSPYELELDTKLKMHLHNVASRDFVVLKPIPHPTHSLNQTNLRLESLSIKQYSSNFLGLYTAPYGSHGLEILHLSLYRSTGKMPSGMTKVDGLSRSAPAVAVWRDSDIVLQGLKVTGDRNVPAGQVSFVINLSQPMNVLEQVQLDRRFIVVFPHLTETPQLLSLEERLPNILFWARGFGQLNRNPALWNPEWVGCSFIFYRSSLAQGGVSFSLLWDDDSDPYFRHAMDFQKLQLKSKVDGITNY